MDYYSTKKLNNEVVNIEGRLTVIERMKSSKYGNPKYKILISTRNSLGFPINEVFVTDTNASLGYSITNHDNKLVKAEVRYRNADNHILKVSDLWKKKR